MIASTRLWRRVLRAAAWDGLLPVFVISIPFIVKFIWPKHDVLTPLAAFIVPIFAAMLRAAIAQDQLTGICNGKVGCLRQLGLAVAIILLLLFEIAIGALGGMKDAPLRAWMIPVGLYSAYLLTIAAALRPAAPPDHSTC